jgi:long-chain-fatty-acid--CoA ligase ACSBG
VVHGQPRGDPGGLRLGGHVSGSELEASGIAVLYCSLVFASYATNNVSACKYVSEHSEARVIVVEGLKQLEKYYDISKDLPHLKAIVVYGVTELSEAVKAKLSVPVYTFDDFCKLASNVSTTDLEARAEGWKVGQVCSLIYTSGTTGPPKVR